MAKFAQYYLKYKLDDMFACEKKAKRQELFGALFNTNDSIKFEIGDDENKKIYKHEVYHLSVNKNIIIMRIANDKVKEVVQDFKKKEVKHEPPCFVIIDNRQGCRRVAIQKCKDSFCRTDNVRDILTKVLGDKMMAMHSIGIEMHPQYYPKDFYKAWRLHQHHTARLRFDITAGDVPEDFIINDLDDDSIVAFAIKVNEEAQRSKYRTVLELSPAENNVPLLVDESSNYIRNLVKFHAQTGSRIEIETNDGARFSCYIDDEEESSSIVTNEVETDLLDVLFDDKAEDKDKAEEALLAFVNGMKYIVDDDEKSKEDAA